jgi:hypothetical protein
VFVDAGCAVGPAAGTEGDLSVFEMAEELVPFGVGGRAVFLSGPQGSAAGEEGAVAGDDFLGVDGFVAHGGVDVAMADDQLGDVGWHAVHDGVSDEDAAKIVRQDPERLHGGVGEVGLGQRRVEQPTDGGWGDRAPLPA